MTPGDASGKNNGARVLPVFVSLLLVVLTHLRTGKRLGSAKHGIPSCYGPNNPHPDGARLSDYNLDFRGKKITLRADNSSRGEGAIIDCGLETLLGPFSPSAWALTRDYSARWLDFPRRGILMVSGEGEDTVVGPGIVVQH